MELKSFQKFCFIFSLFFCMITSEILVADIKSAIKALAKEVQDSQIPKTIPLDHFSWEEREGLYPSYVQLNFFGAPEMQFLRRDLQLFDNNMFVTTWILQSLLECDKMKVIELDSSKLMKGVQAILQNQDKNYNRSSIYIFWNQIEQNETWVAWPTNLKWIVNENEEIDNAIQEFLEDLGLGYLWDKIAPFLNEMKDMADSFKIPPDFDDTSVAIGLGSLLYQQKEKFNEIYSLWTKSNPNISEVAAYLVKYAYRPFSSDPNENSIDPRTYFFLYEYLYQLQNSSRIGFFTTWVMNLALDTKNYYKGVAMPFNVNNIDLSVCSNILFGVCSHLLVHPSDHAWFTPEFQDILLETTKLIQWAIDSGRILERPDLGLPYYPPIHDLYWFLSRTENLLRTSSSSLPFPILKEISAILTAVLQGNATHQLMKSAIIENEDIFWFEFLGQADISFFNESEIHYDDGVFSTAVSLNALLSIWTSPINDSALKYFSNTPDTVRSMIKKGTHWLLNHVLNSESILMNSFFSGSVKGMEQLPFAFPANRLEYLNGTVLPPNPNQNAITPELIVAMSGIISLQDYLEDLSQSHFGMQVPLQFNGFNQSPFPFWSSPSLTKAFSMLALAKYSILIN